MLKYTRRSHSVLYPAIVSFIMIYLIPTLAKPLYSYALEQLGPTHLYFLGSSTLPAGQFFAANALFYIFYRMKHPKIEQFKTSERPWPWEEDKEKWKALLRETIPLILFNTIILGTILSFIDAYFELYPYRYGVDEYPSWIEILIQLQIFSLIEDTAFYWSHRLLHHRLLYKRIHKIHHKYQTTIGIAAAYAHPVEFFMGNILPWAVGPRLMRCHLVTLWTFLLVGVYETCEQHSGYDFPWNPTQLIPVSPGPPYHDFHHTKNVGNFGSTYAHWDFFCGTNVAYIKHLKDKEILSNAQKT